MTVLFPNYQLRRGVQISTRLAGEAAQGDRFIGGKGGMIFMTGAPALDLVSCPEWSSASPC